MKGNWRDFSLTMLSSFITINDDRGDEYGD